MKQPNLARVIIENTTTASLATIDESGIPLVSLVITAANGPTSMVLLLSGLARHTKNLRQRSQCSLLLVQGGGDSGDPLQSVRVTLQGSARELPRSSVRAAREAFLHSHPGAGMYADFGDFAFYQFNIDEAHLIAGFGRVETLPATQLV